MATVIDTNVLEVANLLQPTTDISNPCRLNCSRALIEARKSIVVIDDWPDGSSKILREYKPHIGSDPQAPGYAFYVWLMQNQYNPRNCERVRLNYRPPVPEEEGKAFDEENYAEFPQDPDLQTFDRSDRKFVAVALASRFKPEILNAIDSDWKEHREALTRNGLAIRFLCPDIVS